MSNVALIDFNQMDVGVVAVIITNDNYNKPIVGRYSQSIRVHMTTNVYVMLGMVQHISNAHKETKFSKQAQMATER